MISKELLSVVLGIPLQNIRYNDTTNLYEIFKEDLFNWSDGSYGRWSNLEVNIYELAHKCKVWALKQGYYFSTYSFNFDSNTEQEHRIRLLIGNDVVYFGDDSSMETEVEAIFKACEWILDNKDSK